MKNKLPTCANRSVLSGRTLVAAAIGLLMLGNAQAEWRVADSEARSKLEEVKSALGTSDGNVNSNLKDIYKQQQITQYSAGQGENMKPAEEAGAKPEEELDKESPTADFDSEARCPQPAGSGAIAQQQWQLCQEVVKTELAQYRYSLAMYEVSKKRQQRLQAIQRERSNIGTNDQGKLQDNNNKLLELISLMEIDRQQQQTYMDAYEVRLRYLHAAKNTLARQVMHGNSGATSFNLGDVLK
jgi:hypothetical protein